MNLFDKNQLLQTRRSFLTNSGMGLGASAFASLLPQSVNAGQRGLHHKPKAKRVIFLFMAGAPSQLDLLTINPTFINCTIQNCQSQLATANVLLP